MNKLVVILGPTSSGKSDLAIKLAKKFHGEIISADSRQVYKQLNLGAGKVTKKEQRIIRHHLLDVVSPKKQYTVSDFKRDIKIAIAKIVSRGKIPFLVGGTAFYIYAAIDDWQIPEVPPNPKIRKLYEQKSVLELFKMLKKLDPKRAQNIDRHNKRRLIRALEIIKALGSVPSLSFPPKSDSSNVLILGLKKDPKQLKKLIAQRVQQRFKQGLIAEVKKLLQQGLSLKRLNEIGLTYRIVADYLVDKIDRTDKNVYKQLINKVAVAEYRFSKRQMTWFKRDQRIHWIKNQKQAESLIKKFVL